MNEAQAATSESPIQNGMALLRNNLEVIDKRMTELQKKLQPILSQCPKEESPEKVGELAESPLLNDLINLKGGTEKIINGLDELLQRIQC